MQEVETVQRGISHKPFNEKSEQHQQFLKKLDIKKGNLLLRFPFLKF
jgi:hypothetical protein